MHHPRMNAKSFRSFTAWSWLLVTVAATAMAVRTAGFARVEWCTAAVVWGLSFVLHLIINRRLDRLDQ